MLSRRLWRRLRRQQLGIWPPAPAPQIEGEARLVSIEASYAPGTRIFHRKFGYGSVRAAEGEKLDIDFDKAGIKKVIASFVVPADQAS